MATKKAMVIKDITQKELDNVWNNVMNNNVLGNDYNLLEKALKGFPKNTNEQEVAVKISIVDLINSTHLSQHRKKISLSDLTNEILSTKDFDKRVSQGDVSLVDELVENIYKKYGIKLTSFVSKYCHYHNTLIYGKDDFSIVDGIVKNCLPEYAKKYNVPFTAKIFDNYVNFSKCIEDILNNANVKNVANVRAKFDYLMWYYNR